MKSKLLDIAKYFFKLGLFGFGGPLAIVANIQKDLIEKKRWISSDEFNSAFSLIKAMPGPVAFMSTVFIGRTHAGFWGGFIAGVMLNLPAFFLMMAFAYFSNQFHEHPNIETFFIGMQIATIGVVLSSLKNLFGNNYKKISFWILVCLSALLFLRFPNLESLFIILFGLSIVGFKKYNSKKLSISGDLFWVCFKAGALVFGTGLAIVPTLKTQVVDQYHWLTYSEFMDALAFGQLTPGPVVITVTYIGFKLSGLIGALMATIAIYLASFIHMSTWFPHVFKKIKGKSWVQDFSFGAIAAVIGPIIVTTFGLAKNIPTSTGYFFIAVLSFILSLKSKLPVWSLIPLSGFLYLILKQNAF